MAFAVPTTIPFFADLIAWQAAFNYVAGMRVYNGTEIYVVHTPGVSGSAGGPTGTGTNLADPGGTVTWDSVAPLAPAWSSGTAYTAGQRVTSTGSTYQVINAGPGNSTVAPLFVGPPSDTNPVQFTTSDGYTWVWCAASSVQLTTPTAYQQDTGWIPGMKPPAQQMNWFQFWVVQWLLWLRDLTNQALTWTALETFSAGIVVNQSSASPAITVTAHSGQHAISAQGVTGQSAVLGTGGGTGAGVNGEGGAATAIGVVGRGGATGGAGGSFQSIGGDANGANATGVGTGIGLSAVGGNAGQGVYGQGGGNGAGTGTGVEGHGGRTSGVGGLFVGGPDSDGVQGTGTGTGAGVVAAGGTGYGLVAIGNAASAPILITPLAAAPVAAKGAIYYDSVLNHYFGCIDGATWVPFL